MYYNNGNTVICPVNKHLYIGWPPEWEMEKLVDDAVKYVEKLGLDKSTINHA